MYGTGKKHDKASDNICRTLSRDCTHPNQPVSTRFVYYNEGGMLIKAIGSGGNSGGGDGSVLWWQWPSVTTKTNACVYSHDAFTTLYKNATT